MKRNQAMGTSRRDFLHRAGLVVATTVVGRTAIAAESTHPPVTRNVAPDAPVAKSIPSGSRYDVIVIGGGFAGLTAARDCSLRGMKTLLLEARARIGGRTFTSSFIDDRLELGGTWVHWTQPFVWDEITRYGLHIVETPGANPDHMTWISEGKRLNRDGESAFTMLADSMAKYCDVDGHSGRTVFPRAPEPFYHADLVRRYDKYSMIDRLNEMNFKPIIRDLIAPQLCINCNRDPSTGALIDQLKWWSLGQFDMALLFDKLAKYRIEEGTSALANSIISDGDVDVMLQAPVGAVDQTHGSVKVTTTYGSEYFARAVVCAAPVNVLKTIDFKPGLSALKLQASRAGVTGLGTKCYILIKQKIGKWMGCGSFPNPITLVWTEQQRDDGTLLVSFGPPAPGLLDILDNDAVQAALRKLLPGVDVVSTFGYQWVPDPYSQGTWCFYRPEQMTGDLKPLRAREGNVFFASADSAYGWRGFIDGAIESGTRVGHDVTSFLKEG